MEELRTTHHGQAIALEAGGALDGLWDEHRMAQVFSNLIGNALQHGSNADPVRVRLSSAQDEVVATVWNAGQPIPHDKMRSIFDPLVGFAAHEAATYTATRSLGIGLYIAREVILAHGGSITVSSTAEAGTTFAIRIPKTPHPGREAPRRGAA